MNLFMFTFAGGNGNGRMMAVKSLHIIIFSPPIPLGSFKDIKIIEIREVIIGMKIER